MFSKKKKKKKNTNENRFYLCEYKGLEHVRSLTGLDVGIILSPPDL
jgi:hypothetical protein